MAKKTASPRSDASAKQSGAKAQIARYQAQQKWLLWAGVVLVVVALLLLLATGYSYNWWRGSSKDALRSFDPAISSAVSGEDAEQEAAGTSGAGSGGQGGSGGSGGGSGSVDIQRDRVTTNSVTNNNTTVKETNTESTTGNDPSPGFLDLLNDIEVGDNLDSLQARANDLGVSSNCHTEMLIVIVCDFKEGDRTITAKGLVTDDLVTSVSTNF